MKRESANYRLHNDCARVGCVVTPNNNWLLHGDGAIVSLQGDGAIIYVLMAQYFG